MKHQGLVEAVFIVSLIVGFAAMMWGILSSYDNANILGAVLFGITAAALMIVLSFRIAKLAQR